MGNAIRHPPCCKAIYRHQPQTQSFNLQSSIFNLQFSIFNLQFSIFNFQFSIFNFQSSIFNFQSSQSPKHPSLLSTNIPCNFQIIAYLCNHEIHHTHHIGISHGYGACLLHRQRGDVPKAQLREPVQPCRHGIHRGMAAHRGFLGQLL